MSLRKARSFLILLLLALIIIPLNKNSLAGENKAMAAASENRLIVTASVNGTVVPVTSKYIARVVKNAEEKGAEACILELNTPGGLYSATQDIVTTILNARVPVIVYVSPQGGWAGSAGTFITLSAHIAAMAPGSRIGAAHPVGVGSSEMPEVPTEKITEDASAWVRSIAQMRGKNAQAAELAVRESKSYSDTEALKENLIDIRAGSLNELLTKINGSEIELTSGENITLNTKNAALEHLAMNSAESFLLTISNPDLAYILLTLGMAGIMVEIYHPGLIFPGVIGGISLLLGLYSLGSLDAYWGGVLLIILAFGLFIAEVFVPSHGLLGTGGVISFITGSLILFSNGPPGIGVSIWLIITTTIFISGLLGLLVMAIIRGQKRPVITGQEALLGETGIVREELNPRGTIFIAGEIWNAETTGETIPRGEKVVITEINGLSLKVQKK